MRVIFRLMRWWPPDEPREVQVDLYEEIKAGRKTSEFRDATEYWTRTLFKKSENGVLYAPKVDRAWFIVGFPKGNVPRLEADVIRIDVHCDDYGAGEQYEIKFENVVEVLE